MTVALARFSWTRHAAALLQGFSGPQSAGSGQTCALSQRQLSEAVRDSGLPAEDLLGPTHDAGMPFFLRPGFGEGRR